MEKTCKTGMATASAASPETSLPAGLRASSSATHFSWFTPLFYRTISSSSSQRCE